MNGCFRFLRKILGIRTQQEIDEQIRAEKIKRLTECFTTITEEQSRTSEEDTKKRLKESQIRPRLSFSENELKSIDEIAIAKKASSEKEIAIDFNFHNIYQIIDSMVEKELIKMTDSIVSEIKSRIVAESSDILKVISENQDKINILESVWMADEKIEESSVNSVDEILESMISTKTIENFIELRNRIVGLMEIKSQEYFDKALIKEFFSAKFRKIGRVERIFAYIPKDHYDDKVDN